MPGQVFQVVQCYSCHTFQVQQRKKVNKWVCKMCGEKQSIKKVYGEGSGADCRVHVQKLNTLRGELDHSQQLVMHHPAHREPELGHTDLGHSDLQYRQDNQLTSRWGQFMDDDATNTEEGVLMMTMMTTIVGQQTSRCTKSQ
ncbi:MRN complex-interacting protein-like [Haliotis rubra]|uniref:MRN complex-interacting protein-like n=1 Tax=Haliotis rubra TaxID=36100 RepID=UPI001EE5DDD3|nr:MRN complex-interacting protein-like [Haliotis rubra]